MCYFSKLEHIAHWHCNTHIVTSTYCFNNVKKFLKEVFVFNLMNIINYNNKLHNFISHPESDSESK